jgi:multidrug efflux pump subunit AcrB
MIPIALRRPITILVIFLGLMLFSVVALKTIPIDIFPRLNAPTIYVIEQYGGMSRSRWKGSSPPVWPTSSFISMG